MSGQSGEHGHSLEEMAEASGASVRTIRFYRQCGLIRPPRREGRRVFYPPEALDRLQTILALRDRGFGLDAIAKILDNPKDERSSIAAVLQMSDELRQPWIHDPESTMSALEVLETVGVPDRAVLDLLERSDLVRRASPRQTTYHVPSRGALEVMSDLLAAGVTPEVAVGAWGLMNQHLDQLATDLVARFTDSASEGVDAPFTWSELTGAYMQLRPIAMRAVQIAFAHQIEEKIASFVEQGQIFEIPTRDKR